MTKPRLLVLTSTFPRWEDDHEPPFVYELARRLTDRFDVTVLAPHAPGALRREVMDGIRIERFRYAPDRLEKLAYEGGIPARLRRHPWLTLLIPLFLIAQLFASWQLVRRQRPEVLHAHWVITGGLVGTLLRALSTCPFRLVVTAHGGDVYGLRHPLLQRLKRWVLGNADAVSCVSKALARELEDLGVDPGRLTVQAMGTDLQALFVPRREAPVEPVILYAGRLVEKKGVDILLRAFCQLHNALPAARLVIAGHGPEQAALARLATELGISAAVEMHGPYRLADLPALYARASLAAFPFRVADGGDQDGLGLAIVEAMGCQVPVIATRLPVLAELVEDGVTGRSVPVDDEKALAAAMLAQLQDPSAGERWATTARQRVLQFFDWQVVAERYAQLLSTGISPPDAAGNPPDN